jgi:YD repeat-containing protein
MKATLRVLIAVILAVGPATPLLADQIVSYPGSDYTTATGYDAVNNVVAGSYVDSLGNTLGYTYDVGSQSYTSVSYPGAATTTLYDSRGGRLVGSYSDATNSPTHGYTYDTGTASYTALDYPGAASTLAYSYDSANHTIAGDYTDNLGHIHSYSYDTQSNSYTNDDLPGQLSTYTYDATGGQQVGQYTDMLGQAHGFIYDAQSHVLTTVDGPAGNTTVYSYDPLSQIAAVQDVDNLGHTTSYLYDAKSGTLTPYSVPGATTTYLQRYIGTIKSALDHYETDAGRRVGALMTVPEPATYMLVIGAIVSLGLWRGARDVRLALRRRG